MRTLTHTAFGLTFAALIGLAAGVVLSPALGLFVILGALLPDIDTTASFIGRAAAPLAGYFERKYGHRTVTHSFLGMAMAGLLTLPLFFFYPLGWAGLLTGYLSHLLIDAVNKSGVPLFYPNRIRAVMPKSEQYRISVGSKGETILLVVLVIILAVVIPLNRVGFPYALHHLLRTTGAAIVDYRAWQGEYRVTVEASGTFQTSQRKVTGQFDVLGVANTSSLVVYDPAAKAVYTIGTDRESNIYTKTILARKGERVRVETQRIEIKNELLGSLLKRIPPGGNTFLNGTVKTTDKALIRQNPEEYATLKQGMDELELRYATRKDILNPQVQSIFVVTGLVFIQTILPANSPSPEMPLSPATEALDFTDVTDLFIPNVRDPEKEIMVKEGDLIKKGQLIARLSRADEEGMKLQKQEEVVKEAEELLAIGAISDPFLQKERLSLGKVQQGSLIYSPVDGKVLSLRVHVIHGGAATIALRVLYRKE